MKRIDEITRVLGERKSDSLMNEENRALAYLDSAKDYIMKDKPRRAWEELQEAERSLMEAMLLRAEGVAEE